MHNGEKGCGNNYTYTYICCVCVCLTFIMRSSSSKQFSVFLYEIVFMKFSSCYDITLHGNNITDCFYN